MYVWLGVMVFHCVCQYVTVCDCMSVREWEVCGVEMALMELDVVHNRQDISSETETEREKETERKREKRWRQGRMGKHYHKP